MSPRRPLTTQSTAQIIVLAVCVALFSSGCSTTDPWHEPDKYVLTLDGRLTKDAQGYYHLSLLRDRFQTVHRIAGTLLDSSGAAPYQEQRITFESSHTWSFQPGDTIITIYRRNVDLNGQWVVIDTSTITAPTEMLVPTVNPASYTNLSGEFSTMIGPVLPMLSDTLTITATWTSTWYTTDTIRSTIRVVLE
ncbi:MAG: hypothetical protein J5I53_09655 [Bradyrhizobiaceae bacterium]|nr:hypothetical protein [Bradyrhizobiaceae bacterium]